MDGNRSPRQASSLSVDGGRKRAASVTTDAQPSRAHDQVLFRQVRKKLNSFSIADENLTGERQKSPRGTAPNAMTWPLTGISQRTERERRGSMASLTPCIRVKSPRNNNRDSAPSLRATSIANGPIAAPERPPSACTVSLALLRENEILDTVEDCAGSQEECHRTGENENNQHETESIPIEQTIAGKADTKDWFNDVQERMKNGQGASYGTLRVYTEKLMKEIEDSVLGDEIVEGIHQEGPTCARQGETLGDEIHRVQQMREECILLGQAICEAQRREEVVKQVVETLQYEKEWERLENVISKPLSPEQRQQALTGIVDYDSGVLNLKRTDVDEETLEFCFVCDNDAGKNAVYRRAITGRLAFYRGKTSRPIYRQVTFCGHCYMSYRERPGDVFLTERALDLFVPLV